MDWFRRNWPDLLIGIALVAVIAGIIATLITGGSFFPVGQNARTTPPPAQNGTATPGTSTPGGATTPSTTTPGTTQAPDATASGTSVPAGATTPSTTGSNGASTEQTTTPAATPGISVLPPTDGEPSGTATPSSGPSSTAPTTSAPATTAPSTAAPVTTTPSASTITTTPSTASGPGDDAPYRVSVGAFGQLSNAQAQAATFRAAGYPVFLADQDDLNIVLVGPYATESEAEAAAARIRSGGFEVDPVIYRFRGDDDGAPATGAASTPAPAAATSTTTGTSATPAATPAASSSAAGRFIQVGAYGSSQSAQPQVERLSTMGYRVTERTEGTLIKLLIGPFEGERLAEVQSQLKAAGIESFTR